MEQKPHKLLPGLTILYLILPCFLFAFGWLRFPYSFINISILSLFVFVILVDLYRTASFKSVYGQLRDYIKKPAWGMILALTVILIWLLLSGTGGFGFQNTDYRASNALLNDLIVQDWPVTLTLDGVKQPFVYYFAYYLPAAAIGKFLGWNIANLFLFLWTFLGILLSFFWFVNFTGINSNQSIKVFGLSVIFCLVGGLDLFGSILLKNEALRISNQNEWWAGYFQYSSNTTLIYWVPQQAIACWLVTGLIINTLLEKERLGYLGIATTALILWSPFGVVGVAPFLLVTGILFLLPSNRKFLVKQETIFWLVGSMGIGIIYLLYITSNKFAFPAGFIWQTAPSRSNVIQYIVAFWILEFALLGLLILILLALSLFFSRTGLPKSPTQIRLWLSDGLLREYNLSPIHLYLFLISLSVLTVLPFFRMGIYNDLVMRASIPALFIIWIFVVRVVMNASVRVRVRHNWLYSFILVIIILGFYPAVRGISRSFEEYHFGPPALSKVSSSVEANSMDIVLQRVGDKESIFYRYLSK